MAPKRTGTPILVRIPTPVLTRLDATVTAGGYDSRAELIRRILEEWLGGDDR